MLRNVILLSILAFAVPTMPGQQKPTGQQVAPTTHNQVTSDYEEPRENKPQGWHKLITWPEGITAWALIATLIVFCIQANLMRVHAKEFKQLAKAAADNAKAAKLSAQAVINAERALLLFVVEKEQISGNLGRYIFHIRAVNYGKLPARRIEIQANTCTHDPRSIDRKSTGLSQRLGRNLGVCLARKILRSSHLHSFANFYIRNDANSQKRGCRTATDREHDLRSNHLYGRNFFGNPVQPVLLHPRKRAVL
jgi:hypothetical protein